MSKSYYSLGLMSGTSMDGVDASIIQSDGKSKYKAILDKYFEYPKDIFKDLTTLRDKIKSSRDLKRFEKQTKSIEKEITLFHAKAANKIIKKSKLNVDFIGFHGQTIFHNAEEQISRQLGDGKLLSKLTKKKVVYNFRHNDLKNGGQGAPLTPIFHKKLLYNLVADNEEARFIWGSKLPLFIINIGGVTNITCTTGSSDSSHMYAQDIGPGNYLIDQWIRLKSKKKYDKEGNIASLGKINKTMLEKFTNIADYEGPKSYDVKDFKLPSGFQSLSLKDGAATLTELTAKIIIDCIGLKMDSPDQYYIVISGGGRKNKFLMKRIEQKIKSPFRKFEKFVWKLKTIDDYEVDGDFVESQAFAYLAIRSYLNLPISFPETTGVDESCTGGTIIKNY